MVGAASEGLGGWILLARGSNFIIRRSGIMRLYRSNPICEGGAAKEADISLFSSCHSPDSVHQPSAP